MGKIILNYLPVSMKLILKTIKVIFKKELIEQSIDRIFTFK